MRKILLGLLVITFLLVKCDKKDDSEIAFLLLNGNEFILEIDRALNKTDIQYPSESFQESNFVSVNNGEQYTIIFSVDRKNVTIEPLSIKGELIDNDSKIKHYDLTEGLFAGGRFLVWENDGSLEAEFAVYGSGIPILLCQRGNLVLVEK